MAKRNPTLIEVMIKFHWPKCEEVVGDGKPEIGASCQECETCGSHGDVTATVECARCGGSYDLELRSW